MDWLADLTQVGSSDKVDNNGNNVAHTLLFEKQNDKAALKQIIEKLLSMPKGQKLFRARNNEGRTPLHVWLASENFLPDSRTMDMILNKSKEDVNAADTEGYTLFLTAAKKADSLVCLKCLKRFGADHTVYNKYGNNALHIAAGFGILESVKYLVSIGTPLEHQDNYGFTPNLVATHFQKIDVMAYLISQKANIFAVDKHGENMAHILLRSMRDDNTRLKDCIQYLMSLTGGRDLFKLGNKNKETPLQVFKAYGPSRCDIETIEVALQSCEQDVIPTAMPSSSVPPKLQGNDKDKPTSRAAHTIKLDHLVSQVEYILQVDSDGNNIAHKFLLEKHESKTVVEKGVEYLLELSQGSELFRMTNKKGWTPLHIWLASENPLPDSETVEMVLAISGEKINGTDELGNSMFLTAAGKEDSVSCLKCLNRFGAVPTLTNKIGRSALHLSAQKGILESAKYLVSIDLSLEHKDSYGCTPLLVASYCQKIDVMNYLITQRANILAVNIDGNNVAHLFLFQKHDDIAVLRKGVEYLVSLPQGSQLFSMTNGDRQRPLHVWLGTDHSIPDQQTIAKIQKIVKNGLNATDTAGYTMFLTAATKPDGLEWLKCLKDLGADERLTLKCGSNALHLSARSGILESVKYLLSIQFSLNNPNKDGCTPLHFAADCQRTDVIKYLIEHEANVLAVNINGDNIAHLLLRPEHTYTAAVKQCIKYLLSLPQGQELFQMKNRQGETALRIWRSSGNSDSDIKSIKELKQMPMKEANTSPMTSSRASSQSQSTPMPSTAQMDWLKNLISRQGSIMDVDSDGHNIAHLLMITTQDDQSVLPHYAVYLASLAEGKKLFQTRNELNRTPLHAWIESSNSLPDPNTIRKILETSGEDINAKDTDGRTMFLSAAGRPDAVECLKCLLKLGANNMVTDKCGRSALHVSVGKGHLESVKYLLSIGVPLEQHDKDGSTPLHDSAYYLKIDVMKYLVANHANVLAANNKENGTAHHVVYSNVDDPAAIKCCMEYLMSLPQAPKLLGAKNKDGITPLHGWIKFQKLPDSSTIRKTLRISKEDINSRDIGGATMYFSAASRQNAVDCLKCLKDLGADCNVTNTKQGRNALHVSAEEGILESVKYLVSIGFPLEIGDLKGNTPLLLAASFRHTGVIKYLVSKGANIFAVNSDKNNAAHMLQARKDDDIQVLKSILQFLLSLRQAKKLFQMTNESGRTPLHSCLVSSHHLPDRETFKMILAISGEDVKATCKEGNTMFLTVALNPNSHSAEYLNFLKDDLGMDHTHTNNIASSALHHAATVGSLESLQYLESIGLSPDYKNDMGDTPLHVAAYWQHLAVMKYLIHTAKPTNVCAVNNDGQNVAHMLLDGDHDDKSVLREGIKYLIELPQGKQLFNMTNTFGRTPLHSWIAVGNSLPDRENMKVIIQNSGMNLNAEDNDGYTMFLRASKRQDSLECLKCLTDLGANRFVTVSTEKANSALHHAAIVGALESVQYLKSIGLSPDYKNDNGDTPLHVAAYCQNLEVMKYLIHSAKPANVHAVNNDGDNVAHMLLDGDHDDKSVLREGIKYLMELPQGKQLFNKTDKWGRTPLHSWIAIGDSLPDREIMKVIIQNSGMDLNAKDNDGYTMFLSASRRQESLECLKCLTDLGADRSLTVECGKSAIHLSAEEGNLEAVNYFLSTGFTLKSLALEYNDTPLLHAAFYQNVDSMKYLIKKGADLSAVDKLGNNTAHLLLYESPEDMAAVKRGIEYLRGLSKGRKLFKMKNKFGQTPRDSMNAAFNGIV